jgi:flagellar biosynthetic protein FliR
MSGMAITSAEITGWLGSFLWPFFRIGAMVAAAPIFGTGFVPMRLRILFALVLTVAVSPLLPAAPSVDPISGLGLLITIQQILIGLSMGFILQLVFAAFVLGGQVIAMGMGLGFASMNDPESGVVVPTVGQFYTIAVTLIFLALNGHLIMINVVVESFQTLPVAATGVSTDGLWGLVAWGGQMFAGAVMIALPAITALLAGNIGFGVMTRAAPQLNIFAVGFGIIMILGFVVMMASLPTILPEFRGLLEGAFSLMRHITAQGG